MKIIFILILFSWGWRPIPPAAAREVRQSVLVLHSYHKAAWTDSLLTGIDSALNPLTGLDLVVEYMDTKRLKSEAYYRVLDESYRLKYGHTRFDAILTSDDNAYRYALSRQDWLFQEAPIVFCGVNRFDPDEIKNRHQVTGVVEKGDFKDTLGFAATAHPKAASVHVILDHTRTAQINRDGFLEVMKRNYPGLAVRILIDRSLADLAASLAALPASDFAFFISYWQDGTGKPVSPDELAAAFNLSAVPIYGRSEWMINKGLTGGKCVSGFHQGQAAGQLVKRILAGEAAGDIPVNLNSPNRFMFDYRLLKRHAIELATLPPGSILFNQPEPTFNARYRWLIWSVITILIVLTTLVFFLTLNITRRKQMEVELRQSEARYRQLIQHAPAGIYEIDLKEQCFLSVNDVMCNYTGYSQAEFLDLGPLDLLTEKSGRRFTRRLEGLTPDNPTPPPTEYRIRGKGGKTYWVLINASFVFEAGVPVKATAVAHDLTALRQAEAEKQRLEAKLNQVQKMESLGTLAGGIAHDFNNLLMGIQGNASLMKLDDGRSREDEDRLTAIEQLVQRGVELTHQLLGLARGGKYEVKPTDLNRLVRESTAMFSRTKKEIHIHQKQPADLWGVACDQGQIHQVLLNIFVNAWQAMPAGGDLFISTENTVLDDLAVQPHGIPAGRYVKIAIADSGSGMDRQTIAKIFDPFFTTKERQRGTGLGLASAYGIIHNHDGIIEVSSRLGQGSTFRIYLPAIDSGVPVETVARTDLQPGSERILLVDDEAMVLGVGQEILGKLGYHVIAATSGKQAVEMYRQTDAAIDLVVLDMIMPDMSGAETFNQLKRIDPQVRVLLCSGYSIDGQASEILDQGCQGFIQKPFSVHDLSRKVREVLDAGKTATG